MQKTFFLLLDGRQSAVVIALWNIFTRVTVLLGILFFMGLMSIVTTDAIGTIIGIAIGALLVTIILVAVEGLMMRAAMLGSPRKHLIPWLVLNGLVVGVCLGYAIKTIVVTIFTLSPSYIFMVLWTLVQAAFQGYCWWSIWELYKTLGSALHGSAVAAGYSSVEGANLEQGQVEQVVTQPHIMPNPAAAQREQNWDQPAWDD